MYPIGSRDEMPHTRRTKMSRLRRFVAAGGAAAVMVGTTVGVSTIALAAPRPAEVSLVGTAVPFTSRTPATGDVAGSRSLTIEVWLGPDLAAAQRFATAVSTPGSPSFRHFLRPGAYTARFGVSRRQASDVAAWLRSEGFTAVGADAQRDYVRATAPVSKIDAAFRVTMMFYRATEQVNAGLYPLVANDRPVTLPASLAPGVLGITGLDNAAPVLPLTKFRTSKAAANASCSSYYGQHMVGKLPSRFGTTSFPTPNCGYSAAQLRAAYGANTTNTGKGQEIALIELGLAPKMFLTLRDYAKAEAMPAPSSARYTELNLQPKSCGFDEFAIEEQLDVEASYDMAPGANQLVVGGNSCNDGDFGLQGVFDADLAVINGHGGKPLATIVSNSWGVNQEGEPAQVVNIAHAYLVKAASEGVGMYFSSGDSSGVGPPADDPFATAVGGTTIGLGKTSQRLFETGWSDGVYNINGHAWSPLEEDGASGGGPSLVWRQPSYQKGVVPASMSAAPGGNRGGPVRSVPDISADADPNTGMLIGLIQNKKFTLGDVGGTSLAAPLVAGMVTAAQQGQARPFGFLNPTFYKLAGTRAFDDALPLTNLSPALWRGVYCGVSLCGAMFLYQFDDQSTSLLGYNGQVMAKGYDNMTGVGTPNGQDFIGALRKTS
jgi:subtilase family serine protease